MNRRDFIKTSVAAGGALLASTTISGQAMNLLQSQKNDNRFVNDEVLKVYATSICWYAPIRHGSSA